MDGAGVGEEGGVEEGVGGRGGGFFGGAGDGTHEVWGLGE